MNSRSIATKILCIFLFSLSGIASASKIDDVRSNMYAWCKSWQSRDISRYMSFYSPDFRSEGLDYQSWMKKKAKLFKMSGYIQVEMSDLWVFIEGNHATASFVQRYKDPKISDVGEKTLTMVNSNGNWEIVSEEWKPLSIPTRTIRGLAAVSSTQELGAMVQTADKVEQGHDIKTSPPNKVTVKSIKVKTEKDREKVFIALNNFSTPEILTLEGDRPRVVIDIKNVSSWSGKYKTPVNGNLIKQIRTHLHRDTERLRIVLDLNPSENYIINQIYYQTENMYCIEVR